VGGRLQKYATGLSFQMKIYFHSDAAFGFKVQEAKTKSENELEKILNSLNARTVKNTMITE
jgi:hypothetical protein